MFSCNTQGFWNFKTTQNKSWKLKVESFGNYAGQSYEQIRRWRSLMALKFDKICPSVGTILVLSAGAEKL